MPVVHQGVVRLLLKGVDLILFILLICRSLLLAVAYSHDYAPFECDRVWAGLRTEEEIKIASYHPQYLLRHVVPCTDHDPDRYGE